MVLQVKVITLLFPVRQAEFFSVLDRCDPELLSEDPAEVLLGGKAALHGTFLKGKKRILHKFPRFLQADSGDIG